MATTYLRDYEYEQIHNEVHDPKVPNEEES